MYFETTFLYIIIQTLDIKKCDVISACTNIPGNNMQWNYPNIPDVQDTDAIQILPMEVVGEWNYSNPEKSVFEVKNDEKIHEYFKESFPQRSL